MGVERGGVGAGDSASYSREPLRGSVEPLLGKWGTEPSENSHVVATITQCYRGIGTGMSEAPILVPIFPYAAEGGARPSSYFRQGN